MAAEITYRLLEPGGSMDVYTTQRKLHAETRYYNQNGSMFEPRYRDSELIIGFTKPDNVVHNAKVDGFRKPSSYQVAGFDRSTGSGDLSIAYSLFGVGVDRNGWRWEMQGSNSVKRTVRPPSPVDVNEVRMKVLNNIKDEVFDAAMVLAEMQSTVNTVSSNLNRVGRSLKAISKKNPRHFYYLLTGKTRDNRRPTQKFLKESSGLFLEWKYGITPTLLDLQGACAAMDMNNEGSFWKNPPILVARSSRKTKDAVEVEFPLVEAGGDSKWHTALVEYSSEYKARCDYRINSEGLRGLNRYGIGLGSIATVAWDKSPFTFVLDMVIPIADIVKAWSALSGTSVVGYCETLYTRTEVKAGNGTSILRDIPVTYSIIPYTKFGFTRTAFDQPPMPVPYVRNPIKVGNLATVLALFTQLRKSA